MAHDIEPIGTKDEVSPYEIGVPAFPMAPQQWTERPAWTEIRAPYRPDHRLEYIWSMITLPLRAFAVGVLWCTFTWLHALIVSGIVTGLVVLVLNI